MLKFISKVAVSALGNQYNLTESFHNFIQDQNNDSKFSTIPDQADWRTKKAISKGQASWPQQNEPDTPM